MEVVKHEHNGNYTLPNKGKKVIKHAREVYPYCSGTFAGGVHSYLSGDDYPKYDEQRDFKEGYFSALRDLKDNYVLRF
ncbi:hypothetical protein HCO57_15370 [Croceivirga sp. JEA036]|nr:hypothetical protein [Croceivirga sp. JEA036]